MENQGGYNRQRTLVFADLEIDGRRVECPRCHVPFIPHLGIRVLDSLFFWDKNVF